MLCLGAGEFDSLEMKDLVKYELFFGPKPANHISHDDNSHI